MRRTWRNFYLDASGRSSAEFWISEYLAGALELRSGRSAQSLALNRKFSVRPTDHPLRKLEGVSEMETAVARCKFSPTEVEQSSKLLTRMDGQHSVYSLSSACGIPVEVSIGLLERGIDEIVALAETEALKAAMPAMEITRWPMATQYINRAFWENTLAIRRALDTTDLPTDGDAEFLQALCGLHLQYLMGETLKSHYYPDSIPAAASQMIAPGEIRFAHKIRCASVNQSVPPWYMRMLVESLGVARTRSPNSPFVSDGLIFGETRWTWLDVMYSNKPEHVYTPVDTVRRAHVENLREAVRSLYAAKVGVQCAVSKCAARALQLFVCLHPFGYGNMGLIMNIINQQLRRKIGGYLPHSFLDWFAQRLDERQFAVLFERYVRTYLVPSNGCDNHHTVAARLVALSEFLHLDNQADAIRWIGSDFSRREIILLA